MFERAVRAWGVCSKGKILRFLHKNSRAVRAQGVCSKGKILRFVHKNSRAVSKRLQLLGANRLPTSRMEQKNFVLWWVRCILIHRPFVFCVANQPKLCGCGCLNWLSRENNNAQPRINFTTSGFGVPGKSYDSTMFKRCSEFVWFIVAFNIFLLC